MSIPENLWVHAGNGRGLIPFAMAAAVAGVLIASFWPTKSQAEPVWGAQVSMGMSTCGGEVLKSHLLGPLGASGVDVELTASQLSCGGMYNYVGDLPYANARATASLSAGTLGIYAQADGLGQHLTTAYGWVTAPIAQVSSVSANMTDLLSFTVPAHSPGTITLVGEVEGSSPIGIGGVSFSFGGDVTCTSASCSGMLSGDWAAKTWYMDEGVFSSSYSRYIDIADTDSPLTFDLSLRASLGGQAYPIAGWVYGGSDVPSVTIDYLHTAGLGFTLPGGVTFTSASNEFLTAVPVPAAVWLFGSALLGLIGVGRRREADRPTTTV